LICFFHLMLLPPPNATLFPYTTLFRSCGRGNHRVGKGPPGGARPGGVRPVALQRRGAGGQRLEEVSRHVRPERLHRPVSGLEQGDRKSTRLNSSHVSISYAVFCLKKKN